MGLILHLPHILCFAKKAYQSSPGSISPPVSTGTDSSVGAVVLGVKEPARISSKENFWTSRTGSEYFFLKIIPPSNNNQYTYSVIGSDVPIS